MIGNNGPKQLVRSRLSILGQAPSYPSYIIAAEVVAAEVVAHRFTY